MKDLGIGKAKQRHGPKAGQNINIITMENDVKVLIKLGDCFINPDQITHISGYKKRRNLLN